MINQSGNVMPVSFLYKAELIHIQIFIPVLTGKCNKWSTGTF